MLSLVDLLKDSIGNVSKESIELNIEEFKLAVCQVDSQMEHLPATGTKSIRFCEDSNITAELQILNDA